MRSSVVGAVLLLLSSVFPHVAQSQIPIPEYYGTYAVQDDGLIALSEGRSTIEPEKIVVDIYSLKEGGKVRFEVTGVSSNARFMVFRRALEEYIQSAKLFKIPHIRNWISGLDPVAGAMGRLYGSGKDAKTIPMNGWFSARIPELEIHLLTKPLHGQDQMVILEPDGDLPRGLYVLSWIVGQEFTAVYLLVGGSNALEPQQCFDVKFASAGFGGSIEMHDYLMRHGPAILPYLTPDHYELCGTETRVTDGKPRVGGDFSDSAQTSSSACTSYDECLNEGNLAWEARRWTDAVNAYRKASSINSMKSEAWRNLGFAYMEVGRYQGLPSAWDHVLSLGEALRIPVHWERTLGGNKGWLVISTEFIAFVGANGDTIFSSDPKEVTALGVEHKQATQGHTFARFGLQIKQKKKYHFEYVPLSVQNCESGKTYSCPEPGLSQQETIGYFVIERIPKIVSGDFPKSAPGLPTEDERVADIDSEIERWDRFVRGERETLTRIPPPKNSWREIVASNFSYEDYAGLYVMALNRHNLAADALTLTEKFLEAGDLDNVTKYAGLYSKHFAETQLLFKAADRVYAGGVGLTTEALYGIYRATKEASVYGWFVLCGPKCSQAADIVFLLTDFALDVALQDTEAATKQLVAKAIVMTLLNSQGLADQIQSGTTHWVGGSGLYESLNNILTDPEFTRVVMKVTAESAAHVSREVTEGVMQTIVKGMIDAIDSHSNIEPSGG
ncbi:MAG TPA: tetratricopeptide repeat protein [Acidobacteriota bacterium]|nr:tetratricopeptide repeat protein [Acidobacteriota bacterium]